MRALLYPRLRLDLSYKHILRGFRYCRQQPEPRAAAAELERFWAPQGNGLATLSVRSAFALFLQAVRLPRGSEVLLSAVTIPDMARLVREQGLVPVPVDVDRETLAPTLEALERAWSSRARVLVVAHLLGGRMDFTPIARWAQSKRLWCVEDCAQGFIDRDDRGSDLAHLTCYSFGTIKTLTAAGGALTMLRDPALLAAMRRLQASWPVQPTSHYARRLARAAALLAVQEPHVYRGIERGAAFAQQDFHELILGAIRGFPVPPGSTLGERLRFRPSGALLKTLHQRLAGFEPQALQARAARGEAMMTQLRERLPVLGTRQTVRTHWLVGVEVPDRRAVVARGLREGFDLAGATNICALPIPAERRDLPPLEAGRFMERVLFVPAHAGVPAQERQRLVDICAGESRQALPARRPNGGRETHSIAPT